MAFTSNNQHSPKTPGEAFVDQRSIVLGRVNLITHSQELLSQQPMPLQKKEVAVEQVSRAMQQDAQIELPPEIIQSPDLVAWAQQQQKTADIELARQSLKSVEAGGGHDLIPEEKQPDNVAELPLRPEVTQARQIVDAIRQNMPDTDTRSFPQQPTQSDDQRKAA